MPAFITELIDKFDGFEIVRDQIAAILVVEAARQQELAIAASPTPKDPALWKLRVFTERTNPWSSFVDVPEDESVDATPIVCVSWDESAVELKASNVVEQQRADGTFFVDCYGYGLSQDTAEGHLPGDEKARREAHRAARLVRNILMAAPYVYLRLQGLVGFRMWTRMQSLAVRSDERFVQHVAAVRLTFQVRFAELSPQVKGVPLTLISVELTKSETGELLLRADYPK